jgi:cysteine-rich repeat protein
MHEAVRRYFADLRHRRADSIRTCCAPLGKSLLVALVALSAIGAIAGSPALAAAPALSASASASPSATCQQATVNLAVTGTGDPNVQRAPLDVMVVFDRSSSMDDAGGNPPQPISSARSGAKTLVNSLTTGTDRAGLTTFSTDATLNQALTSTLTTVNTAIDNISVSGNTNIADGVRNAQAELASHGRSSPTVRVLVVLTDGVANRRTTGGSCPNTPTSPNACTEDAISKAADAKAAGTYVFTIGLNLNNLSSSTAAVARSTLQQMASNSNSYFESPSASQLSGIFAQIGTIITTLAGSNIVVTHVLPSGVSYLSGSSTPAPTSVTGQTLTWNLGLLNIGSTSNIAFGVSVNPPNANQAVNVVPTSRVDYSNYQSVASSVAFPAATVSVAACATQTPTSTTPPTATPADTSTATATQTPTTTLTPTITETPTLTPTPSLTPTETVTSTPTATATPIPVCGDGTIDAGETCDDGNTIDGDGCDSDCTPSAGCTLIHPGTERFVGSCGAPTYPDIQAAVDAAADGETITVCPGTYTQPVQVTKQVRIRAVTAGTVTVHTAGTAFDIARSGVEIDQLTIQSDSGNAVGVTNICPLGQASCAAPGHGSNVTISNNAILGSPVGIGWTSRIDCAQILNNTLTDNAQHIAIQQQDGPPAVLMGVIENDLSGGGTGGAAITLSGVAVTVAANTIALSKGNGLVLANVVGGGATQVIENNIRKSSGDGIQIGPGGDGSHIHDNNITANGVGLNNQSGSGTLDATLNWWNSQSGPSGLFTGHGDSIVNASGSTTDFIEFLCKPFPEGFASVLGVCSVETAELTQLVPGRAPDIDKLGKFITFESVADMDVDPRTSYANADGSQEVYLLNRRPRPKLGGVCLGGTVGCDLTDLSVCTHCSGRNQCPGDPSSDPIVLNG